MSGSAFEPSPGFKGLWIPICILIDPDLPLIQRVILAEVYQLQKDAGCFASNAHFSALVGCKERNVRNHLSALTSSGLLRSENATSKLRRLFVDSHVKNAIESGSQTPVSEGLSMASASPPRSDSSEMAEIATSGPHKTGTSPPAHPRKTRTGRQTTTAIPAIDDSNEALSCPPTRQPVATEKTRREQEETEEKTTNIEDRGGRNFARFAGIHLMDDLGVRVVSDATWEAWMERQDDLWLPPEEEQQLDVLMRMARDGFNGEALVKECLRSGFGSFWERPPAHLIPDTLKEKFGRGVRKPLYEV